MKTSNKFTLLRVLFAPVIFFIYSFPVIFIFQKDSIVSIVSIVVSILLLIFAELTDYFDGFYARKHKEVSDFGKLFDPFADVLLHLSMFTIFVFNGYMPVILYVLIFFREFGQNFLRMVAAKIGTAIAARKGGKVKTVFYVASCFVTLLQELLVRTSLSTKFNLPMDIFKYIGWGFFGICTLLAWISFIDYLKNFGSVLVQVADDKGQN